MIPVTRRFFVTATAAAFGVPFLPVQAQNNPEKTIYDNLSMEEVIRVVEHNLLVQKTKLILKDRNLSLSAINDIRGSFHPEHEIDASPGQQELFKTGRPLEFTKGFLYHGRSNLPQIILDGYIPENSYVTRVPQTWALQPFVDLEADPAIFVIDAFDFNREVNAHRAALRLQADHEIYPSINEKFPLDKVVLIFITLKDIEKYLKLIERFNANPESLSQDEKRLAAKMKDLFDKGKIRSFDFSEHENLNTMSKEDRFLELRKELVMSLHWHGLKEHLPRFQLKTDTSTRESDHSPELRSEADVNKKIVAMNNKMRELLKIIPEVEANIAAEVEAIQRARDRRDLYRLLGLGALTTSAIVGGGWWIMEGIQTQEQDTISAKPHPAKSKKRKIK